MDTGGLVLKVVVHPAQIQDRDGAALVLADITTRFPHLQHLWADTGYTGGAVREVVQGLGLRLTLPPPARTWVRVSEDAEPPPRPRGFQVLPRRWVVERTFAWLGRWRRLSKDYEALPATEEAWIYAASSMLLLARVAK